MEKIIFYILLFDALIANILAYFGESWYIRHFRVLSRLLPLKFAWTLYYLILVLYIGYLTF